MNDGDDDKRKKVHKRGRNSRRVAATAPNPDGSHNASQPPAPAPPSRINALLADLAAAQTKCTSEIPSLIAQITSASSTAPPKAVSQAHSKRTKDSSVAARISRQLPPPPPRKTNTAPSKVPKHAPVVYRGSQKIPAEVLDDISFRFLLNIPDSEKSSETRICFQIELAHWFYIDYYVNQQERADCPDLNMREFIKQIFAHNDFLADLFRRADEILDNWRVYKSTVPTYGGILLDSSLNYVLLVQGYYANKNSWGFPKGKVNECEPPRNAAVREVFEETGFDFSHYSPGNEYRIQKFVNDTMVRLYVVADVPTDYPFAPHTRCEIRQMKWFSIWELPAHRNEQPATGGLAAKNFYSVVPFVSDIQHYVRREQSRREKARPRPPPTSSAFTRVHKKRSGEIEGSLASEPVSEKIFAVSQAPLVRSIEPPIETVFRPLNEGVRSAPAGSKLATLLAGSPGSSGGVPQGSAAPLHPVPIRAPSDRPVYVATKENSIPKKGLGVGGGVWKMPLPASNALCSATQLEDHLHQMLFSAEMAEAERAEVDGGAESEAASEDGEVQAALNTGVGEGCMYEEEVATLEALGVTLPLLPSVHSPFPFTVQLCRAWDRFKLDRDAVFEGAPLYA